MKKLFTILCLLVSGVAKGQCDFRWIDFDNDTCYRHLIAIDTINYHHNLWQIGKPQKTVFNSALTSNNAIVTDTLNPYPTNDTSVFTLKIPTKFSELCFGLYYPPLFKVSFFYKLNIDSNLIARMEISKDSGLHWVDVKDSLPGGIFWDGPPANLSVPTTGWGKVSLYVGGMPDPSFHDTLLFRFTLISDTVFANREGWMIDHFELVYWCEGAVHGVQNPTLITLYPNPSHGNIYIYTDKPHKDATITIHNIQGQQVYSSTAPANSYLNLQLPNGIYTLKYSDEEEYCVKQIVIQN